MATAILGEKTGVRNLPSMRTEGDPAFPRVLIIVDQGVAMVHTVGNVEVCLIDFDCVREGDLQEMSDTIAAAFPRQAKELADKTKEVGAWLAEQDEPEVIHTACRHCDQDIEGIAPFETGEWRDRGNSTHCPTPEGDKGQKHEPVAA